MAIHRTGLVSPRGHHAGLLQSDPQLPDDVFNGNGRLPMTKLPLT
jgi:hypothetical protein